MGEQTEAIKIQQSKFALLSGVVQSQITNVLAALGAIAVAYDSGQKVTAVMWFMVFASVVNGAWAVVSRAGAEGPLRFRRPPSGPPAPPPSGTGDLGGDATPLRRTAADLMTPLRLLAVLALFSGLSACASRDLRTDNDLGVEWWEGPPCRVEVRDGDELVLDARSPKPCRVNVTPGGTP